MTRLPSAAAATCRVSAAAQAASARGRADRGGTWIWLRRRRCGRRAPRSRSVPLRLTARQPGRAGSQRRRSWAGSGRRRASRRRTRPGHPPGRCRRQCDGVPGDLAGVAGAEPLADQHPGRGQPGEELLLTGRAGRRGADLPAQRDPGSLRNPRRGAFSVSARVGRRAAVRSPGAVRRSPNRSSAARQASRTR